MKIETFIKAVEAATQKYTLKTTILARTENAVKMRLDISENIFVQFYSNQLSGVHNYVLVGWNRRLYRVDSLSLKMHCEMGDLLELKRPKITSQALKYILIRY